MPSRGTQRRPGSEALAQDHCRLGLETGLGCWPDQPCHLPGPTTVHCPTVGAGEGRLQVGLMQRPEAVISPGTTGPHLLRHCW